MSLSKLSVLALASMAVAELQPITIKGAKFFYENGTQFYMKGVAYQEEIGAAGQVNDNATGYKDPLADVDNCKRDVPLLKELGTNTIRTYAIDPEADHSGCMELLDAAGIYVISDLSQPQMSIKRDVPQWNVGLFERYTSVVDELSQYSNVIGFFAGNEVSDASNNTEASAYVKAALRDTKKYIKDQDYRPMGVGYASNDHPKIRDEIAHYFNCGTDEEATDFWGYNIYSWCGESTLQESGYDKQIEFFKDYNVPSFFAEYGCNTAGAEKRIFTETEALYEDEMTSVFSGGIVYMYHQEENDYGLVEISKDGKATRMKNFAALKKYATAADPKTVEEDSYTPTGERSECPELTEIWRAGSVLPPTPDKALCDCAAAASDCGLASSTKPEDYGDIFNFICDATPDLCIGINGNATTGVYGAYSMCSDTEKLTYLLGAYHAEVGGTDSCDFEGMAEIKTANAESSCDDSLASASAANDVAVTAVTGSASAPTSTGDATDFGITSSPIARIFSMGDYAVGLYMLVAAGTGAAMIAL